MRCVLLVEGNSVNGAEVADSVSISRLLYCASGNNRTNQDDASKDIVRVCLIRDLNTLTWIHSSRLYAIESNHCYWWNSACPPNYRITRMWVNAQRDGHPTEYRWLPCSTPQFGSRPLEWRAVTLPRRESRWNLLGCPKLYNEPISAACGPKFIILWGHVGRYCCLTNFSDCQTRYVP